MSQTRKVRDDEFDTMLAKLVATLEQIEKSQKKLLKEYPNLQRAIGFMTRKDDYGVMKPSNSVEFIASGFLGNLMNQFDNISSADRKYIFDAIDQVRKLQEKIKSLPIEPVPVPAEPVKEAAPQPEKKPPQQIDAEDLHDAKLAAAQRSNSEPAKSAPPPRPTTPLPTRKPGEQRQDTPMPPRKSQSDQPKGTPKSKYDRPVPATPTASPQPARNKPDRPAPSPATTRQDPAASTQSESKKVSSVTGSPMPGRKPPPPPGTTLYSGKHTPDNRDQQPNNTTKPGFDKKG